MRRSARTGSGGPEAEEPFADEGAVGAGGVVKIPFTVDSLRRNYKEDCNKKLEPCPDSRRRLR